MPIELIPAVYWVTQDSEVGYTDTLTELVRRLRPFAKSALIRYAPPERSGLSPEALAYCGLMTVRHKILDQYLPAVEPNRVRSLARLWPWWDKTGMKVLVSGSVETLATLPSTTGEIHSLEGRGWTYTFYRNQDEEERHRWVCHWIKECARAEKRALTDDLPLNEDMAHSVVANDPSFVGDKSDVQDLLAITDPADWRDAAAKGDPRTRKRCQRAMARLRAGCKILELSTSPAASAYRKRLLDAEGKQKQSILNEFLKRYMKKDSED